MLFRILEYSKYLLRAKNAHGLHSPFLFDLYNKCLLKNSSKINNEIESKRKSLKNCKETILSYDAKTNTFVERKIADIAKTSLSTKNFSAFLSCLSSYLKCKSILETGTSLGINTLYLAEETRADITTIEKNQHLKKYHQDIFKDTENVEVVYGDLSEVFSEIVKKNNPELIFLDADHRSSSILKQLDIILSNIHSVKAIVIHDIYWSRDMKQCWEKIIKSNDWNCTVDIFHAGIIFPKLEIPKQHFTIKF